MINIRMFPAMAMLVLMIMLVGCSGGSSKNPVTPSSNNDTMPSVEMTANIPDDLPGGSTLPMLFGMYEVEVNSESMTGSIHPLRQSELLGDALHVDITPFLSITPCADCIKIKSVALTPEGYLQLTILTKHPFQPEKRYDLNVFDMRGIVVMGENPTQFDRIRIDFDSDGSYETPARGTVGVLVNADGYTSFYDGVVEDYLGKVFDGNICPYKNLWMNPATTAPDSNYDPIGASQFGFTDLTHPTGHNVFPMGGSFADPLASTAYTFNLGTMTNINFLFILEACYGQTTRMFTRKEPRYFLPEFQRKDAWEVTAQLTDNNLKARSTTSTANLAITVKDWQAGIAPLSGWDFHTSPLTAIKYKSDVKSVVVDIPGILLNVIQSDLSGITGGNGSNTDPSAGNIQYKTIWLRKLESIGDWSRFAMISKAHRMLRTEFPVPR